MNKLLGNIKNRIKSFILIVPFHFLLVFWFLIFNFNVVISGSMFPTIATGDALVFGRISDKSKIERFDIISFKPQKQNDEKSIEGMLSMYVKRVIGLPGETVELVGKKVYVNGEELDEPHTLYSYEENNLNMKIELADDEYFMMGDNRDYSEDSENFGPIKEENIKRKVVCVIPTHVFTKYKEFY